MNSLNDFKEFYDRETASSSGLFHVASHAMSIPCPRGMLSRNSCLQPETRNSYGTSGNVFEDLLAPNEPSASRADELERYTPYVAIPTPRLARKFSTGILDLLQKELILSIAWLNNQGIKSQNASRYLSTSQCWKTSFKTEVCSYSNFRTELMLRIQDVEMVESADDLCRSKRPKWKTNFFVEDRLLI